MSEQQEKSPISAAARALAARRRQVTRPCAVCGTPITGTKKKLYCSHACTLKAWRQRTRAREQEGERQP